MAFRVSADYCKEDFRAFSFMHFRTKYKVVRIWQLVSAVILLIFEILLIVMSILYERPFGSVELLILLPVYVAVVFLLPRIQAYSMAKIYRKLGTTEMIFGDDQVWVQNTSVNAQYQYSAFLSVYHGKDAFYLYIYRQQAILIPERCFTEGDPANFGAFISEKTGLECKEIN